ncbi:MAG TPA: PDZ domain-containing protein [Polyangiaceae bacterium]|nr:PDZ domain-containing protein [Polyangiaceae bacterium]
MRWGFSTAANFFVTIVCLGGVYGCVADIGTIGALLGQRPDGRLFVRETPPGLAAARHGVEAGDEILLIDGKDVRQMGERELYRSLSGDVGTTVKLTLVRGDAVIRVTLARTPAPPRASAKAP